MAADRKGRAGAVITAAPGMAAPEFPGRPSPVPMPLHRHGPSHRATPSRKGFVMLLTLARLITAALLIASAAASATGVTIEHHAASSESQPARHAEAGTPGESPASGEGAASGERPATHAAGHGSENLPGINPETTGLVVIAVAVPLLLAALILTVGPPLLAVGVTLTMLAFTALDVREVTHQLNEPHPGLAALAATIAALHLAAGAAALLTTRGTPQPTRRHHRPLTAPS
jgi:hypothetical protein